MTTKIDMRDAFFNSLYEIMKKDKDVVILTADHGAFGLNQIQKELPSQYYNVGISEQNMISMAAGLADCGKKVYVYAINNFISLRVLEQLNIDVCSMNLDVNLIAVGAGFTYSTDGPTHHGVQDVSSVINLPNLSVFNVTDSVSTEKITKLSYESSGPKYVRIEKGIFPSHYEESDDISVGCKILKDGEEFGFISTGYMTNVVSSVCEELKLEGINASHLDVTRIKPLPVEDILSFCEDKKVIVVEENLKSGGLSEKIASTLKHHESKSSFLPIAVEDSFVFEYGSRDYLHIKNGLDKDSIKERLRNFMEIKEDVRSLDQDKFCEMLSFDKSELTENTKNLIDQYSLSYRHLDKEELETALHTILSISEAKKKVKSGSKRKSDWEKGWQENLDEYKESLEQSKLKPKYYRPEEYARMDGTYVSPFNDDFVFKFSRILQSQIYEKFLCDVDSIYEFGCGSGHNLEFLHGIYPNKKLVGLDWSNSAIELVNMFSDSISKNISGKVFDFFNPEDHDFSVNENSAFITMGGLEQVGDKHGKYVDFILDKNPEIVINIEPIQEFYDKTNLSDFIASSYHEERNYLKNYYTSLLDLEKRGLIKIEDTRKVNFGGLFHDGWSVIIWRPTKK